MAEMTPADVPEELVKAASDGWWAAAGEGLEWEDWLRVELAAVLPLHEQRLRERLAAESADAAVGSYAGRACAWPACLTEAQQLELAENVRRSMLGEDTGPDPVPDCECPERLRTELNAATTRAERAEAALAEMRERLGEPREQWGVRMRDTDPAEDIEIMSSEAQARECATAWRGEIPGTNPIVMRRTERIVGQWHAADATPRTALERAAEEPVRCGAECSEGHTYEPGSCEAAVDPDEVIAQNHRDAARDWGIADD